MVSLEQTIPREPSGTSALTLLKVAGIKSHFIKQTQTKLWPQMFPIDYVLLIENYNVSDNQSSSSLRLLRKWKVDEVGAVLLSFKKLSFHLSTR